MSKRKKSKYAAKLDQRLRDRDIQDKADRKAGVTPSYLSFRESFQRHNTAFVAPVPIEEYVKQVADRNAKRNAGRPARAERPEPPAHNFARTNFAYITPAFSGLEHDVIDFAGHEFAPIAADHETGNTYLHIRNSSDGWEIERHFMGGWGSRAPVKIMLPSDYAGKDEMIAKLEKWVSLQKTKGLSLSFYHMSTHAMASMVNPKTEKPAPTRSSERAKQWGNAIANDQEARRHNGTEHLVMPSYRNVEEKSFTLFGKEFPATGNPYGYSVGTYFSAITSMGGEWEIVRCVDTNLNARRSSTYLKGVTKEDVVAELAAWVREQELEGHLSHLMHSGKEWVTEVVLSDSDGFRAPFLRADRNKPDPRELTYG